MKPMFAWVRAVQELPDHQAPPTREHTHPKLVSAPNTLDHKVPSMLGNWLHSSCAPLKMTCDTFKGEWKGEVWRGEVYEKLRQQLLE